MSYPLAPPPSGGEDERPSEQSHGPTSQSPLDWNNFMNFSSTPPIHNASNGGRSTYGGQQPGQEYQSFAQGIAMSQPSPSGMNFQPPYPKGAPSRSYAPNPSPLQHQVQLPSQNPGMPARSPSMQGVRSPLETSSKGKGKSPIHNTSTQPPSRQPSNPVPSQDHSTDNGLSLDPSAFSRDIRFQMPSFLSNHVGGAPTFPPGGEAWSGFSGASFSNSDNQNSMTPGTLFNHVFGLNGQSGESQPPYNQQHNPLQGFNGYMQESGSWENWNGDSKAGAGVQSMAPPYHPTRSGQNTPRAASQSFDVPQQRPPAGNGDLRMRVNTQVPSSMASQSPQTALSHPSALNSSHPTFPQLTQARPPNYASNSMSTSAILPPQQGGFNDTQSPYNIQSDFSYVPSISGSSSNVNIASSSSAPYVLPQTAQDMLSGAAMAPPASAPSLTDGPGLYSTTGFDMVSVLARVAGRKDPKTVLGLVDLSCSFVVVDIRRYDAPIVYASPTFLALTGYELPSMLGRNCRFLQSPDGEVVKGSKRKYTDNVAVAHLKRMLNAGKECQASLINYRRGGVPFINLVTVVPIPWDGTDIVYHVGFQVDLVEQPNAILRNMRDGSYQVNYTVANPPQAPLRPPGRDIGLIGLGQDIMEVLGNRVNTVGFAQGEDGARMEWYKMILENADGTSKSKKLADDRFVHVLSLKGMFQFVSASVRRVLEYEPEELLNKNIADICHPSDIVPLMRELKDSTHAPIEGSTARMVNLTFRIRRKNSGYVWIECCGRLHVEPGKGRKAVILSGRPRAVPYLPWDSVARYGGLSDTEFWVKLSFQGIITTVTSTGAGRPEYIAGRDSVMVNNNPTSPVSRLASAFRAASNAEMRSPGIAINHSISKRSGEPVEVTTVIYPSRGAREYTKSHQSDSSDDSSSSRPASSGETASGLKPSSLIVQVKIGASNQPIAHRPSSNVFEELETTRGTSWQYELHQLRLLNRRLKDDIAAAKAKGAKAKGRKRKAGEEGQMQIPAPQPALPEHFNAAPRHQLAPGFGLVAPGMQTTYY